MPHTSFSKETTQSCFSPAQQHCSFRVIPTNSLLHDTLALSREGAGLLLLTQVPDLPKHTQKLDIPQVKQDFCPHTHPRAGEDRLLPSQSAAAGPANVPYMPVTVTPISVLGSKGKGCKMVQQYHLQGRGEAAIGGQEHSYSSQTEFRWAQLIQLSYQLPLCTGNQVNEGDIIEKKIIIINLKNNNISNL